MPRHPLHAPSAEGLSDTVFGQLVAKSAGRSGRVFPLHVGDTYLDPLPAARAEAQRSEDYPRLHNYAPVQGEPELLDAVVAKVRRRSGVELARDDVQVMAGATGGLGVVATAILAPGDEVLLPAPFWPLFRGIVRFRGATPVEVPFFTRLSEPGFNPIAALEAAITPRTTAIYLNSPHNPTGALLAPELIPALGELARKHDLWVITDEVYEDVYFGDAPPASLWAHPALFDRAIVTHSVSKAYGLAGARVGYTHGPSEIMRVIRGVQTFYSYCAPRPMQLGAARALSQGDAWLADARERYATAASMAAEALGLPLPAGGTFLFFDGRPYLGPGEPLMGLLERCLEAGVMLTPGTAAGVHYGEWLRLCFTAVDVQELGQALDRLRDVLAITG